MNRHFLLGIAIFIFALGIWKFSTTSSEPVIGKSSSEQQTPSVQVATSEEAPAESEDDEDSDDILSAEMASRKFAQALSEAGKCLDISMLTPGDQVPPTLTEWLAAARNDLGDPVVNTEDWSVTTIRTPSGEVRHIRFEIDYSDPANITQKLSYYMDRGDGTAQTIPLDPDQARNPSETFKATLESDGEVIEREKSQRIYYETGEEIVVTEKDGQIVEIDMNRQGRNFSCRPFDPAEDTCVCR